MMDGYLSREVKYRDYHIALTAGVEQSLSVSGDYWQLIKTPGGELVMDLDEQVTLTRSAPCGGPGNYQRVTLKSPVDQVIVVALGFTNGLVPYDNRTVISTTLTVTERVPSVTTGLPDLLVPAGGSNSFASDLTRDSVIISVDDTAPDYVRVVSGGVGEGVRVYPGGSVTIRTTAAITVRNPNGVGVTVSATQTANP